MFTRIKTADAIEWDNEVLFQGCLVLSVRLPDNYDKLYARATSNVQTMPRPIPNRMIIPIVNGQLATNRVLPTEDLSPPNTRYVSSWYDSEGTKIGADSALFEIDSELEYEITPPTLTAPTAPS